MEAWEHAREIGLPLNEHVTFRPGDDYRRERRLIFKDMRDRLAFYARQNGFTPCFVWTRELDPENRGAHNGEHMHALIHIPPDFRADFIKTVQWMSPKANSHRVNWLTGHKAIHVTPEGAHYRSTINEAGQKRNILLYLCNQLTPAASRELNVQRKSGGRGAIFGKRNGWTNNLGPKAREQVAAG